MTELPDREVEGTRDRDAAVAALLRQLSTGLSTYRLFPGHLTQPAYVAAVERIRAAAQQALAAGPAEVGIHGDGFVGHEDEADETLARLASALFDRRVELLEVRREPDHHDLAALYEVLTLRPEDLLASGGVPRMLRRRGVSSITVRDVEPEASVEEPETEGLTAEQRELWQRLLDPAGFAADLMVREMTGSAADQAEAIYRRFRALVAALPAAVTGHPDLYARLHRIVAQLPVPVRRAFAGFAIGHVESEQLAQGYLGTMTDAELARVLADLGDEGPNPVDVARRLMAVGDRGEDLADLTFALLLGREDSGAIVPEFDAASGVEASGHAVVETVSDLLARAVQVTEDEDVSTLRNLFPRTPEQRRTLGLLALRDYLTVEDDGAALDAVLGSWVEEARAALLAWDGRQLARLVDVLDDARDGAAERRALVDDRRREVADQATLRRLIAGTGLDGYDRLTGLLRPLADAALGPLLEVLAEEEDAGVRGQLVAVAADLARPQRGGGGIGPVVQRLSDARWYVVRNALVILERLEASEAFPQVATATRNPHPSVRRECVRVLPQVGGARAVPHLTRLALDRDASVRAAALRQLSAIGTARAAEGLADVARRSGDGAERREALDRLAGHPADNVGDLLRALGSRRSTPRLPLRLRWLARRLARARRRP